MASSKEFVAFVEELDNRELLCRLLPAMYDQLPEPKKKKPKK